MVDLSRVVEVRELVPERCNTDELNEHLKEGWVLLAVAPGHSAGDDGSQDPYVRYSLGLLEEEPEPKERQQL